MTREQIEAKERTKRREDLDLMQRLSTNAAVEVVEKEALKLAQI